jgi:ATP-binding cassette subfamily B protein
MNNGKIIEQGDHDSLIAADGFYKKLYESGKPENESGPFGDENERAG